MIHDTHVGMGVGSNATKRISLSHHRCWQGRLTTKACEDSRDNAMRRDVQKGGEGFGM